MRVPFHLGIVPGDYGGSCFENCGFRIAQNREMPFREWNSVFRESLAEFRELLRECLELSKSSGNGLFTPRAFPESWGGPQASDSCHTERVPFNLVKLTPLHRVLT